MFYKKLRQFIKRLLQSNDKGLKLSRSELLDKSWKFIVNECIEGDYYEFGVWRGQTFFYSFFRLLKTAENRIKNSKSIGLNIKADKIRQRLFKESEFHAFDSFEGLPELTVEDSYSDDFLKGQFASGTDVLESLRVKYNVPKERIRIHKGWFKDTCNFDYYQKNNLKKATIIWLDCDIYSSAKDCFNLITFLIQDGTILIIDDWFSNKGSPLHGVQKAFYEWSDNTEIKENWILTEYQKESWKRTSFIINKSTS